MKSFNSIPAAMTVALGLSLAGIVVAQSTAPTARPSDELNAAHAELARAAQRVAELSGRDGLPTAPRCAGTSACCANP